MSYTTNESLDTIISELRTKLPDLERALLNGIEIEALHGTVEMLSALIARYDRGEIVEKG